MYGMSLVVVRHGGTVVPCVPLLYVPIMHYYAHGHVRQVMPDTAMSGMYRINIIIYLMLVGCTELSLPVI